ncbi:MAG: S8 family peptidase [Pseudomonadota bacterium]
MKRTTINTLLSLAAVVALTIGGTAFSPLATESPATAVSAHSEQAPEAVVSVTGQAAHEAAAQRADIDRGTLVVATGDATGVVIAGSNATAVASAGKREAAVPARAKLSGQLAAIVAAGGSEPVDLIASFAEQPELFDDARVAELGGEIVRSFDGLQMRAIRLPANAVLAFAERKSIDWLTLDDTVGVTSAASRQAVNEPTSGVNNMYRASGVGVAVLDTGIAQHADLDGSIKQFSFLNGQYPRPTIAYGQVTQANDSALGDNFGHGTHVAGIITGTGYNSNYAYRGTARSASLVSLQALGADGKGSMSDVLAALDWLLEYGSYFDIRVVNLSIGKTISESIETDPLVRATDRLWDAGMVVVVAAGNDGRVGKMSINSPGNSRKVITVGSLTENRTGNDFSDDYVSSFSSRGPSVGDLVMKPDLVAPGNKIIASIQQGSYLDIALQSRRRNCSVSSNCQDRYLEMSGTSMAAPLVAATAARMLDKDPSLTPDTIKARLMRSARKLDESPIDAGAGVLDVDAAMNDSGVVNRPALSPLAYKGHADKLLIEDTAALWGHPQWAAGYLFDGGFDWATDGVLGGSADVNANGFLWTDETIGSNGYLWTDEVFSRGYLWTDETVSFRSNFDVDSNGEVVMLDD